MKHPVKIAALVATMALGTALAPGGSPADATVSADVGAFRSADAGAFRADPGFRPTGSKVRVKPRAFEAVAVDVAKVRAQLAGAPAAGAAGSVTFRLPDPAGGTERFAVQRTRIMQRGLAAAHPEIQTWSGVSLDHAGTTVALDVTPMGFHASVRGPNGRGMWYVDPAYNARGTTQHLVYDADTLPEPQQVFNERELPEMVRAAAQAGTGPRAAGGATVTQRIYRLALLSDPTYADYFGSQNVLAEKVTLINRVNQIYNDDLAITLVLVDGSDKLNLDTEDKATGTDGPCGLRPCFTNDPNSPDYVEGQIAYCDLGTLVRTQTVIGQLIGAENYDIGHIALGTNGGGIAFFGVGADDKAQACTGIPDPVGDFYAVDYVAHEMGHQFYGNHTFNGTRWNCSGGNRNRGTSVEAGSGSSVMAYAGICRQDNLQPHSDPYFSQRSQTEITRYTSTRTQNAIEEQDVTLQGFDADGETLTLDYPGAAADPVTLTRGSTYDKAHVEEAIETLTGTDVTVAKWGYDPYATAFAPPFTYPAPVGSPDEAGFEVLFSPNANPDSARAERRLRSKLIVTGSTGVTAEVTKRSEGGPSENRGFTTVRTGNHAPSVTAPRHKVIPVRTPFTLTGAATDADGDRLTYLWEQNDTGKGGGTALVNNIKHNGPLFRVFGTYADVSDEDAASSPAPGENHAGTSPSRTFPDLAQILAGQTNALTGRCPAAPPNDPDSYVEVPLPILNCFSEFLPTAKYASLMHFRLTARDSVPNGGGVGYADITLRLDKTAGPFLVSSFEKGGSVAGGSRRTIEWEVNGTDRLASKVAIVLSTDNGKTWERVLVEATPNDGSAPVTIPKRKAGKAWIMIRAVGNYFFDVNGKAFKIT